METEETLAKALDDIREWLIDNGAPEIVENLGAPASNEMIAKAEAMYGARFPLLLRQLYATHDGQKDRDVYPFVECSLFIDLAFGSSAQTRTYLTTFLGIEYGRTTTGETPVDRATVEQSSDGSLRDDELSLRWWPLLEYGKEFVAVVNLDSGRVFRFLVDSPSLQLVAPDVSSFLASYADDLWNDRLVIAGDPAIDDVENEGFLSMKKHTQRVGR